MQTTESAPYLNHAESGELRANAVTTARQLLEQIETLLQWGDIDGQSREALTQAANATELALACCRARGPRKPVKIGF